MALLANSVCLAHPFHECVVHVVRVLEAKHVHVVLRRKRLDLPKAWVLEATGENDVAVEPPFAWRDLSERHANLKGNPCLLGQNDHGADGSHCRRDEIVELADDRLASGKVVIEIV